MMKNISRLTILFILTLLAVSTMAAPLTAQPHIPTLNWQPRSDWINVKKDIVPVAVGNGVADDTAAIQKTLDSEKDGATIYLPAGTYRITHMLNLVGPHVGITLIGNGQATRLLWDGETGGKVLRVDGIAYSDFTGLNFDGQGRAGIGLWYDSSKRFETELDNTHLAFHGFTEAGIESNPTDQLPTAEVLFTNCLFDRCRRGVAFLKFNDYDFTFTGCDFRHCETGIDCVHGNFYARDCHFESSQIMDIHAAQEHSSSVRRCTSVGSTLFLRAESSVGAMTIQDCSIDGWQNRTGAITLAAAPVLLFDCRFSHAPLDAAGHSSAPVGIVKNGQRLILSENKIQTGSSLLQGGSRTHVFLVPGGQHKGVVTSAQQTFLQDTVRIPHRVYDAQHDFGAKGDGRTDDTLALQQTIDAAAKSGGDALAYLPTGRYVISRTLHILGQDYFVGGSGLNTRLLWRGQVGGTMVDIRDSKNITIEHLSVGARDAETVSEAVDIQQTGTGKPTRTTYNGVYVFGLYRKQPFQAGFHFNRLGSGDVVLMPHVQGNLHFTDCAQATILAGATYEGSLIMDGKSPKRGGLIGFQTRLATIVPHALYLRDSQSIVISDFYIEQSDSGLDFEGNPGDLPGRATITGAKISAGGKAKPASEFVTFDIQNYHGEIFFGQDQFYVLPPLMSVRQQGNQAVALTIFACCFYGTQPDIHVSPAAHVFFLANETFGMRKLNYKAEDVISAQTLSSLAPALDDLRRLGEADIQLNFSPTITSSP